jgi:uncharacterized membrane-anchored protein
VGETTRFPAVSTARVVSSKVPEDTLWSWIIKIRGTTVGESFADWHDGRHLVVRYARERTLSIHSIVTTRRELLYWLAVLITFALGTAPGAPNRHTRPARHSG